MHFTGLRLWAEMTNDFLLNWKNASFAKKTIQDVTKKLHFLLIPMQSLTENLWSFYVICLRTKVFWTILPLRKESLFSNLDTLPFRLAFAGHLIKYVPTLLDCNELLYFAQPLSISDYLKNLSKQF